MLTFLNPPRPDGQLFGSAGAKFYSQSRHIRMSTRPKAIAALLDRKAIKRQRLRKLLSPPSLRKLGSTRKSILLENERRRKLEIASASKASLMTGGSSLGSFMA